MNNRRTDDQLRELVKKIRKEKSLTQLALAKKMGYSSASRVSEFETGTTKGVAEFIRDFCKALGLDERNILFYEDGDSVTEVIVHNKYSFRYKVPSIKLSIIIAILLLFSMIFHIISTLIINDILKMLNILVFAIILVCSIVLFIVQWTTNENYVEVEVEDRSNLSYTYGGKQKRPFFQFCIHQIVLLIGLSLTFVLVCIKSTDVSIVILYSLILLLEIITIFFSYNVYKKESTKQGFIIYIFELFDLLLEVAFSTIISLALQQTEINSITYICLAFNEMMLLYFIFRMLDCNSYLKERKIISGNRKM